VTRIAALALASFLSAGFAIAEDETRPEPKSKAGSAKKIDKSKAFDAMDADSDGKIAKDEFVKSLEKMAEKLKEKAGDKGKGAQMLEKLGDTLGKKAFEKLDADGDGSISKDEFEKAEFDPSNLRNLREKFGKKKADK